MAVDDSAQQDQVPPSYEATPGAHQLDEKAGATPGAHQLDEKAGGAPGNDGARTHSALQNDIIMGNANPSLSRRGPVLVLIVAYAVICTWDMLMDFGYLSDPNPLVMTLIITSTVLDAGSLLLTLFGLWAFLRTRVACMAVYVYGLLGFQLLATANLVLFCVAPLPQYLLDAINAASSDPDVRPEDIPSEGRLKLHQALYMAIGLLFRAVYVLIVRRYYLAAREENAQQVSSENA